MKLFKKALLTVCITAAVAGFQTPLFAADKEEVAKLFEQVKLSYEVFTLENGLTVLVYPDHKIPEVYVGVYYRVGSKDEPEGKSGFAHLYEHLMFQGTANAPGEYFSYLNKIGASGPNGTTSTERTNYYQVVPTGSLDAILWLESDRMANITTGITQQQLDSQRGVVKNEKRQSEESSKGYDLFTKNFYPKGHPYDHSPIGSMEDLDRATLDDVHQWFKDYYGANNAVLVLAGDIDVETAKQKAAHYFSDVKPGKKIARVEEMIPELTTSRQVVAYDKVSTTSVTRTWPIPSSSQKDHVLLDFVASTIAGEKESPLSKLLVDELQYVKGISLNVDGGEISGDITLRYSLRPEANVTVQQVNKIIDEELQKFFKQGPDAGLLETKLLNSDAATIRSMKATKGLAIHLTESLLTHDDPEFFRTARGWLAKATPSELKAVAKKWLDQPYLEIVTHPEPKTKMLTKVVDRSQLPETKPSVAQVKFPEFQQTTLDNGLKLVVVQQKGIPMVDVIFQVQTGIASDHNYSKGTASRAFGMLTKASKDYDEVELVRAQQQLATGFSAQAGEYTSSFSFNALTPYLEDAFELAAEVLKHPVYPQKELDKELENIDSHFDQVEKNPSNASSALFNMALWGKDHTMGKITNRQEAKAGVSRDMVLKFHQNEIGANNTTVYMMGDITLEQARQLLNKNFGDWHKVSPSQTEPVAKPESMTGKVILIDTPHAPSATIVAGHMIDKFDKTTSEAITLANGPLGGTFESRINMNLRESKGWSYGARTSINRNPHYEQIFSLNTQVQIDKVVESIDEINKEMKAYVTDKPITLAELDKLKLAWTQSFPSQFSDEKSYMDSALRSESFGLPFDYAASYVDRLNAVTLEQAQQLSKSTIKPNQLVWMIIGDLSQFESKIRAMNLGDVEVWDSYGNKIR